MSNLLEMRGITKSFYGVEVLHKVDFDIDFGEVVALCGENGAGKSTLMKILAGIYKLDEGEIVWKGEPLSLLTPIETQKIGISIIHQELNLLEELTVAQNIFLRREPLTKAGFLNFKEMNEKASQLLSRLGEDIDPSIKVKELKVAQKQIVEIAKAMSFKCDLMIMDEPTSALTTKETDMLFDLIGKLSAEGIAIVYITHRLKEVKEVCDRVTVLRDGSFIATKDVASVSEQDIANLMVGREVFQSVAEEFSGDEDNIALEVQSLSDKLLNDVSFKLRYGEILGFSGLVGAGRTELMEHIFGLRKCQCGKILINGVEQSINRPKKAIAKGVGFATEDRKMTGLVTSRDILENINHVFYLKTKGAGNKRKRSVENANRMIEALKIKCQGHEQTISNLSGGNQQKIVLSKWLLVDSDILILDEPTKGIDVGAREEIYQIIYDLAKQGKAVLIVSSDLTEVLNICQRIIIMYEGSVTGELTGQDRTEEKIMAKATNVREAVV